MKTLYCCGDSFTYGMELDNPETECWPFILANMLKYQLINEGVNGSSNDYIYRKTNEYIFGENFNPNSIVILGFTDPFRCEVSINENYLKVVAGSLRVMEEDKILLLNSYHNKKGIYKKDRDKKKVLDNITLKLLNKIASDYLNVFHFSSVNINMLNKYNKIFSLHCLLKCYNIKHLFFNAFDDTRYNKTMFEELSSTDKKQIDTMINVMEKDRSFINISFKEYCVSNSLPYGESHPLAESHIKWAEYLYKYIKEEELNCPV